MKKTLTVKNLTLAAMFMALNIALSSFGVPVPGGHFYLNDIVICTAAILLDPFCAFLVGGLGAFIGDLIIYQTPMFVSLDVHLFTAHRNTQSLSFRIRFFRQQSAQSFL